MVSSHQGSEISTSQPVVVAISYMSVVRLLRIGGPKSHFCRSDFIGNEFRVPLEREESKGRTGTRDVKEVTQVHSIDSPVIVPIVHRKDHECVDSGTFCACNHTCVLSKREREGRKGDSLFN